MMKDYIDVIPLCRSFGASFYDGTSAATIITLPTLPVVRPYVKSTQQEQCRLAMRLV